MRDRIVEHANRYRMVKVEGTSDIYDFIPVPGEVTEEGDYLNKATFLRDDTAGKYYNTVGGLAVGSTVKLNVNGAATEFIVVHQGNPDDTLYDVSCNGTWLLAKGIHSQRAWNSTAVNDYANSTIHSWLNNDYLALFDSNVQSLIKQVKIPYVNGTGTSGSVASGEGGLSTKIFLLGGYEVGWTKSNNQYFPADGAKLDYFASGTSSTANSKRIANLSGSALRWILRSPNTYAATNTWIVETSGSYTNLACTGSFGIRPCIILPPLANIDDNGFVTGSYFDASSILPTDIFNILSSSTLYDGANLTDILGKLITINGDQIEGGVKIQTGSYVGTGTYGASNPCSLTFNFTPRFVLVKRPDASMEMGLFWCDTLSASFAGFGYNLIYYNQSDSRYCCAKKSGNTISWYYDKDGGETISPVVAQLNFPDLSHPFIAIG